MNIRIRGISYHFEVLQQKKDFPYLVLLHGFLGSGENFRHLIPSLKKFCNPITIDLLGHGSTDGAELHYRFSAKEQVADITKLISEQLHLPLFLYGYSMGGRLALQLALHRADLFQGLILESSTFGIEDETERQARQSFDAQKSDQIMGNFEGFLKEWKSMPLLESDKAPEKLLNQLYEVQGNQNPLWMANSLLGFGTGIMPCLRNRLSELKIPVQLIAGETDSKFLHINQQMQKEIEDSAFHIVKDSGHRVHLDQPEKLVSILKSFIQNNSTL
ncbi:MAG: 2-succinyl-6-hydroxy-2,4-cyclohexadiene-1-carboxylate synthase [Balneolaceae bacterium]